VPEEFNQFIKYCRQLGFEEKPDYQHLRSLLRQIAGRHSFEFDGQYDWILKKEGKLEEL